jgi:hypothetical protein
VRPPDAGVVKGFALVIDPDGMNHTLIKVADAIPGGLHFLRQTGSSPRIINNRQRAAHIGREGR